MKNFNFEKIVEAAWHDYDASMKISGIEDISARVSTNHVFLVRFEDDDPPVIAKLSYFGKYEHFLEDHTLINVLANNLKSPFNNFLSRSLMKGEKVYTYRHQDSILDAWVVFYNPMPVHTRPPKILSEKQIKALGRQMARFHLACRKIINVLPGWSKTLDYDIKHLLEILETDIGRFQHGQYMDEIKGQANRFLAYCDQVNWDEIVNIPVFIDWNIGNFSVNDDFELYSRWDYDWFRVAPRVMDFYFLSRVCSSVGDKTYFSYYPTTLTEERFHVFLQAYHEVYPLSKEELLFVKEAFRFFILNYVIKDGNYFFHELYATRLQHEAFETYFPQLDELKMDKIITGLQL